MCTVYFVIITIVTDFCQGSPLPPIPTAIPVFLYVLQILVIFVISSEISSQSV